MAYQLPSITRNLLQTLTHIPHNNSPEIRIRSFAFSPDGQSVITIYNHGVARVSNWKNPAAHQNIQLYDDLTQSCVLSPDTTLVAIPHIRKSIGIYNTLSPTPLKLLQSNHGGHQPMGTCFFNHTNTRLLSSSSADNTITLWDLDTQQPLLTASVMTMIGGMFIMCGAFSHGGNLLATGGGRIIVLHRMEANRIIPIHTLETEANSRIASCVFSPDDTMIAAASSRATATVGTARIWSVQTGHCLYTLIHPGIKSVTFSFDGTLLATAGNDNNVRIWDVKTGLCLQTLIHPGVTSIAFSPHNKLLATASSDHCVMIWDLLGYREKILSLQLFDKRLGRDPQGKYIGPHLPPELWDWMHDQNF
jgi:WD40 repeat protein